ncbi:LD-carboxypeptidase [Bacillus badius]|uniref:LD-carboxypeptidase n=1 Tax=Bacillus badius TaxID=1455 RepID=UPI000596DB73|nr:LD-carboxypeptidase [Bacillus badius]MED4715460.1 LD-carboxypeptidase [Bacillus badius]
MTNLKPKYLAGSDEQRAFDLIRRNPKVFLGFSDITSLHIAINKFTGLTTFDGPGVIRLNRDDLSDYTKKSIHLYRTRWRNRTGG